MIKKKKARLLKFKGQMMIDDTCIDAIYLFIYFSF